MSWYITWTVQEEIQMGLFSDGFKELKKASEPLYKSPKSIQETIEIMAVAEEVLVTREFYPDKTLADLYDPDKMPEDLREAHAKLDDIVESCYPGYPFASDEARLECLFKLYEKMTSKH